VRPNRIVVQAPGFDDLARLSQAEKPVLVETLVAEPAVEALDVGILVWLAELDEVQPDALRVGPRIERSAGELGPIVRDALCRYQFLGDIDSPERPGDARLRPP